MPAFDTPMPGRRVPDAEAHDLIVALEKRFRRKDPLRIPSNLPLACSIIGRKDPDYFTTAEFLRLENVLFLLEGASLLFEASSKDVNEYFQRREPWEEYDICVFDRTLAWCVGMTHNGDVVVANSMNPCREE